MKKKKIIGLVIILLLLAKLCFCNFVFAEAITRNSGSDAEAIFKDRLLKYCYAPSNPDFSASEQQIIATKNLLNFTKEFPNSRFADDAQYIVINDDALLEKLIEQYPNGKLEDTTIEFLKEVSMKIYGDDTHLPEKTFMSYGLALIYIRGEKAFMSERDYDKTLQYMLDFIKRVDEKNTKLRLQLRQAYRYLLMSYKKLGDMNGLESIKAKMLSLFPEDKQFIEKISTSPAPK